MTAGDSGDVVLSGKTTFDASTSALFALLAEWQRTDENYVQRFAHLAGSPGGLNGSIFLDFTSVLDDHASDTVKGGAGVDRSLPILPRTCSRNLQAGEILVLS